MARAVVVCRSPAAILPSISKKGAPIQTRSGVRIQGHPFLAKPISFSDLIAGIEENLRVRAAS